MASDEHLVEIEDLYMYFPVTAGVMRKRVADVKAVDGVSFYVKKGETLGLVAGLGRDVRVSVSVPVDVLLAWVNNLQAIVEGIEYAVSIGIRIYGRLRDA